MTSTPRPKSPAGRLMVGVIFVLATLWGATAVVGSVVVDLYGAPPKADEPSNRFRERSWCARRLSALMTELDARVTYETGAQTPPDDPVGRWRGFLEQWREDYADAASRCVQRGPGMEKAFANLHTLYEKLDVGTTHILNARAQVGAPLERSARDLIPTP